MSKQITFTSRAGKSWNVTLGSGMGYKNDRMGPHVETEAEGLAGKKYTLGIREVKQVGGNVAVMYTVNGLNNGKYPAHITVYFGPQNGSQNY